MKHRSERRDCVVVGGGPAGSTFAAIAGKYAPHLSVTVLEKTRFPRWHVGEATIPVANGVLRDLELYEPLKQSTHVKKIGAVFVWGQDRSPWNAEFLQLDGVSGGDGRQDIIDVTGQDFGSLLDNLKQPDTPFISFNVRRAEFDELLLNQARAFGADVREGTRASEVVCDASGCVEAVRWQDDKGRRGIIETPFVLDASGLSAVMARGERIRDPHMNNYAVYGYLSGAGWKVTFNGTREFTTLFTASVEKGWIWYFPIGEDIMSVGAVTHTGHFRERIRNRNLETFFWEMLHSCPEVASLVVGARLRDDVLPGGKRVAASRDWSSWSEHTTGNGWASAGDAAVFIDPVLASGLTMALMSGHRAAYTFNTERARPELDKQALWRAYADYVRGEAAAFLKLSRYFYANNRAAESWWWEAQRLINESGRLDLRDRQAFTMAAAGFFPTPRAISLEAIVPVLARLSGAPAELKNVFRDSGVPTSERLARCRLEVLTPFRLDLQAEPALKGGSAGQLEVYHDLVTDNPAFAHRLAAVPCRIPPVMAPVVAAIPRHRTVASLLLEAPSLLPPGYAMPDAVRQSTLDILTVGAMKGFVCLHPEE